MEPFRMPEVTYVRPILTQAELFAWQDRCNDDHERRMRIINAPPPPIGGTQTFSKLPWAGVMFGMGMNLFTGAPEKGKRMMPVKGRLLPGDCPFDI